MEYFGRDAVAFETAPADDEEYAGEERARDEMQDGQDWAGHSADDGEAHEEMRYALLDYAFGRDFLLVDRAA